jgi:hypothetical protein
MSASEAFDVRGFCQGRDILSKVVLERRDWPPSTKLVIEERTNDVLLRRAPRLTGRQTRRWTQFAISFEPIPRFV